MGLVKVASICAAGAIAATLAPQVEGHAFLMLPKTDFSTSAKNQYAYVVPPFSSYTTGNAERNSQGFTTNYKKLNPSSLKSFIMANQIQSSQSGRPAGGSAECGYSNPNGPAQPLPDKIEFGNYQLSNGEGLHPGPCEAYCDDQIIVPFTSDCRTLFQKGIPYDKSKCAGAKRMTFYWLATHFAPFQVYIGCAPLSGGGGGGGGAAKVGGEAASTGGNANAGGNNAAPAGGNNAAPAGGNNANNNGGNNANRNTNNGGNNNNAGGNNNAAPAGGNNANNSGGNNANRNTNNGGNNNNAGGNNNNAGGNNNANNNRGGNTNTNNNNGGNNAFRGREADWLDADNSTDAFPGTVVPWGF